MAARGAGRLVLGAVWRSAPAPEPASPLARTEQLDLAVERAINFALDSAAPTAAGRGAFSGLYASAGSSSFNTGTNVRYRLLGGGLGWLYQAPGRCQQRLGVELQQRTYLNSPLLDGRYQGVVGNWVCERPGGVQWQLGVRWGLDGAGQPDRPGGDQSQRSLRVWPTCRCVHGSSHRRPLNHGPRAPCWWM